MPDATASPHPAFLITVDTEGDHLWSRPRTIETRNAAYLARFQRLCESHGFKPSWLTNHEMAVNEEFVAFGRDVLRRGTGEIGMHLHAWNCPPAGQPLTDDDYHYQPFLVEYPDDQMEAKVAHMTALLRDRFECDVVSHRAGRWALDSRYARLLAKYGYLVDCSVTPTVSWAQTLGNPNGRGGTDYSRFPATPYFLDLDRIDQPGDSPILELPATVMRSALHRIAPWAYSVPGLRRYAWRKQPIHRWLYPDGRNLPHMLDVVREALEQRRPFIEFVIHSSELMPGGSDSFADEAAIDALYGDLATLFSTIERSFTGMTLREFRDDWVRRTASQRTVETTLAAAGS